MAAMLGAGGVQGDRIAWVDQLADRKEQPVSVEPVGREGRLQKSVNKRADRLYRDTLCVCIHYRSKARSRRCVS